MEGSVVHNFSRLLKSQLEEIELSIWQVKTCCLRWYGRWQLIRRLPWHLEGAERVCCRQPIHNCFRCCVLAIILDTAQQVILQGYCEAIINAPGTGTSNLPHTYCTQMAPPCAMWKRSSPKAPEDLTNAVATCAEAMTMAEGIITVGFFTSSLVI